MKIKDVPPVPFLKSFSKSLLKKIKIKIRTQAAAMAINNPTSALPPSLYS